MLGSRNHKHLTTFHVTCLCLQDTARPNCILVSAFQSTQTEKNTLIGSREGRSQLFRGFQPHIGPDNILAGEEGRLSYALYVV